MISVLGSRDAGGDGVRKGNKRGQGAAADGGGAGQHRQGWPSCRRLLLSCCRAGGHLSRASCAVRGTGQGGARRALRLQRSRGSTAGWSLGTAGGSLQSDRHLSQAKSGLGGASGPGREAGRGGGGGGGGHLLGREQVSGGARRAGGHGAHSFAGSSRRHGSAAPPRPASPPPRPPPPRARPRHSAFTPSRRLQASTNRPPVVRPKAYRPPPNTRATPHPLT